MTEGDVDLTRDDLSVPMLSFAETLAAPLADGSVVASGRGESGGGTEFNVGKLTDDFFSLPKSEFPLKPLSTFLYGQTGGDTSNIPVVDAPEAILSIPAVMPSMESIESMAPLLEGEGITAMPDDEDLNYRFVPNQPAAPPAPPVERDVVNRPPQDRAVVPPAPTNITNIIEQMVGETPAASFTNAPMTDVTPPALPVVPSGGLDEAPPIESLPREVAPPEPEPVRIEQTPTETLVATPSPPSPPAAPIESEPPLMDRIVERIVEPAEREASRASFSETVPPPPPVPTIEAEPPLIEGAAPVGFETEREAPRTVVPGEARAAFAAPSSPFPTAPMRRETERLETPSARPTRIEATMSPPPPFRGTVETEAPPRGEGEVSGVAGVGWMEGEGPTPIYTYSEGGEPGRPSEKPSEMGRVSLENEIDGGGMTREIERIVREEIPAGSGGNESSETASASSIAVELPPPKTVGADTPAFGDVVTGVLSDEIRDVVPGVGREGVVNDNLQRVFMDMLDARTEEIYGALYDISGEVSKGNTEKILDDFTEGL